MSPLALALVLGAAVAHAGWNIIAYGSSRTGMAFLWCGALASSVIWIAAVPLTGGLGTDDLAGFAIGIGVAAILHVGYMLVLQRGYAHGNLSSVYAIARGTGPLLTVLVAVLVIGERPDAAALVGVAVVIVGVMGMGFLGTGRAAGRALRLGDAAVIFGLLTGVCIAAYTLWDVQALRTWEISPVAFMVGCTILEVPLYSILLGRRLREVVPVVRREWPRLLAFGFLSPLSYILVLTAAAIAPVSLVAPLREVSVVLVGVFGALVLREGRALWRIAACVLVAVGVALIAL
jgi:drug/metabolite transporter (DMT)-like permease